MNRGEEGKRNDDDGDDNDDNDEEEIMIFFRYRYIILAIFFPAQYSWRERERECAVEESEKVDNLLFKRRKRILGFRRVCRVSG